MALKNESEPDDRPVVVRYARQLRVTQRSVEERTPARIVRARTRERMLLLTGTTKMEALDEAIGRLDGTLRALTARLDSLDEAIRLQLRVFRADLHELRSRIDARATQESVDGLARSMADKAPARLVVETRDEVRSLSNKIDKVLFHLTNPADG